MTIYRCPIPLPDEIDQDLADFAGNAVQRYFHNKLVTLQRSAYDCLLGAKEHDEMVRHQERLRVLTDVLLILHSHDSKQILNDFVVV